MKFYSLMFLIFSITLTAIGQVSINADNSAPDQSAMLDVKSSTKGLLAPRVALTAVNVAEPISNPAVGLLVYNTIAAGSAPDNVVPGYYRWNGAKWIFIEAPQGTSTGDMQYWNGTQWVIVPAGTYGQQLFFCDGIPTWGGCPPVLSTAPVTNTTYNSAVSGGNITLDGGSAIVARGVCWSTTPNPTIHDNKTLDGSGTGVFASNITGLSPNTTYHVRSYASNSNQTGYGNDTSFVTLCESYLTVSVSIVASAINVCQDDSVTFTAMGVNAGTLSNYQWNLGGSVITGATNSTYSYAPAHNDVISCVFTSNTPCALSNTVTSNSITMTVISPPESPASGAHTPSQTQIIWNWSSVPGATGYKWNMTNDSSTAQNLGSATSKTETGLTCSMAYARYVWAVNSCGNSLPLVLNQSTLPCGAPCMGTTTVTYGDQTYNTVQIGTQCWLRENLNIGTMISNSQNQTNNGVMEKYCYDNNPENCSIYGGLYIWNEMMQYVTISGAQGICPSGWHIPTQAQWTTLTTFLGGATIAGGKMKTTGTLQAGDGFWTSPNTAATNESGFSALPAGYHTASGIFYDITEYNMLWTSSETTSTHAWNRMLYYGSGTMNDYTANKSYARSVRCLRDY